MELTTEEVVLGMLNTFYPDYEFVQEYEDEVHPLSVFGSVYEISSNSVGEMTKALRQVDGKQIYSIPMEYNIAIAIQGEKGSIAKVLVEEIRARMKEYEVRKWFRDHGFSIRVDGMPTTPTPVKLDTKYLMKYTFSIFLRTNETWTTDSVPIEKAIVTGLNSSQEVGE
jgi:hypothetical protein